MEPLARQSLTFGAYKRLKQQLLEALTGPLADRISSVLKSEAATKIRDALSSERAEGWSAIETGVLMADLIELAATSAGPILQTLVGQMDRMTETLLAAAALGTSLDDLPAEQVLQLRDAALADFKSLMALEKNSLGEIATAVMAILAKPNP